jgi:hypothetical protein
LEITMKKLHGLLLLAGVATALTLSPGTATAQQRQGRGNADPEQMRQRMMDNVREQFQVKDDAEWKIIQERVQKVMDARRDIGFGGGGMRMFRRPGGDANQADQGNRRRFGGEPSAEEQALQKAIDSKATKDELKSVMAKYREAKKSKEAKLQQAQDELKKVLSLPQEAAALDMGLVN